MITEGSRVLHNTRHAQRQGTVTGLITSTSDGSTHARVQWDPLPNTPTSKDNTMVRLNLLKEVPKADSATR
jgi:hypothetical protein